MIFLREFIKGMHLFGKKISFFVNMFLLLLAYIFGIGITSIVAKLVGKHFLKLNIQKDGNSYWEDTSFTNKKIREFLKQY